MSCIPNITQYSVSVRYVTVLVKEFHMLNSSSECVVIGIMSQALYKYGVLACFHFPGSHGRHSLQSLRQKVNRQTKGRPLFPQWPLRPQICCSSVCVLTCYEWRHQDSIFILLYVPSYSFTLSLMQLFSSFFLSLSLSGGCSHAGWSSVCVWHGEKWTGWVWRPQTPPTHPGYLWRAAHPHPVQSTGKASHGPVCTDYVTVLSFICTLMSMWRSLRCRLFDM